MEQVFEAVKTLTFEILLKIRRGKKVEANAKCISLHMVLFSIPRGKCQFPPNTNNAASITSGRWDSVKKQWNASRTVSCVLFADASKYQRWRSKRLKWQLRSGNESELLFRNTEIRFAAIVTHRYPCAAFKSWKNTSITEKVAIVEWSWKCCPYFTIKKTERKQLRRQCFIAWNAAWHRTNNKRALRICFAEHNFNGCARNATYGDLQFHEIL